VAAVQKRIVLDGGQLAYPVAAFSQGLAVRYDNVKELTTATTTGLKSGYFQDLELVASDGAMYSVTSAEKLRGIGRFGGYNLFLNQTIEIRLFYDGNHQQTAVEQLRSRILASMAAWHGWDAIEDPKEVWRAVNAAVSVEELISLLPRVDWLTKQHS
jgi:hypothetical protein